MTECCLSASLEYCGGVLASAALASLSDAWAERYGSIDATATRASSSNVIASRIGGVDCYLSLVCAVDLHATEGYLRTTEGYVLTINGGYIVLPLMS